MKSAALLFDLDGTLVDSLPDLTAALNALLAETGAPSLSEAEVRGMVGDGAPKLVERGLGHRGRAADPAALARFLDLYEAAPAVRTRPYRGVPETLAAFAAAGRRMGIVTNKPARASHLLLEALGLARFFPVVVGGDTTPWKKPDRRPLLAALDALGAAEAIYVGDNEHDAAAAEDAGFPCLLLRHGYARVPLEGLRAAAILDCFADLPAAVARIEATL